MRDGRTHRSTSTWEFGPLPSPIMRQASRITRDPGAHDACFTRESDRLVRRWPCSRPGCGPRRTPIHRDGRSPGRDSLPSTTGMRAHPRPGARAGRERGAPLELACASRAGVLEHGWRRVASLFSDGAALAVDRNIRADRRLHPALQCCRVERRCRPPRDA
jgi:hypothetical protein